MPAFLRLVSLGFLRETEAVFPVRDPGYDPNALAKRPKAKGTPAGGVAP
jgi:hypothetical protein